MPVDLQEAFDLGLIEGRRVAITGYHRGESLLSLRQAQIVYDETAADIARALERGIVPEEDIPEIVAQQALCIGTAAGLREQLDAMRDAFSLAFRPSVSYPRS